MKTVDINICIASDGFYSAYCIDCPALFGGGKTPPEAIEELQETLRITKDDIGKAAAAFYPDWLDDEYEFSVHYDVQSFLEYYSGVISLAALGKISGIHPKQLWSYAHGLSKPRKQQVARIQTALHDLGRELTELSFS